MALTTSPFDNPDKFARFISESLYNKVVNDVTNKLVDMIKPVIRDAVIENLQGLEARLAKDAYMDTMLVRVFLHTKEETTEINGNSTKS